MSPPEFDGAEANAHLTRPVPDIDIGAATARRMDALVAALTAECAKGEAGHGWVSCRVLRRLLGEVR